VPVGDAENVKKMCQKMATRMAAGSCASIGDEENVKKNVAKINNTHGGRELCWYRMQKI